MQRRSDTPPAPGIPAPEEVFARLGLDPPPAPWSEGWEESQRCLPEPIPFLGEQYVAATCDRIRLPGEQKEAFVRAARFFRAQPLWKRLGWHQHRLMFGNGALPPGAIDYWPVQEVSGEPESLFLALVFLSGVPNVFAHHARRNVPEEITVDTLSDFALRLEGFHRGNGYYGMRARRCWMLHSFAGKLYKIGRLQYEMREFPHPFVAFRHRTSRRVAVLAESGVEFRDDGQHANALIGGEGLATWTAELIDDGETIRGTFISPLGRAVREPVTLDAAEWTAILRKDDPVWDLHIPNTRERMDFDACGESLREAVAVLPAWHPEHPFRAFTCSAWFLDSQLERYLKPASNIIRFMREVYLYPMPTAGDKGMMNRCFGGPKDDLAGLPRDTSLRRAALDHMEAGGRWYNGGLLLFPEDLDWGAQVYRRDPTLDA